MQTRRVPQVIALAGVVLAWLGGGFSGPPPRLGADRPHGAHCHAGDQRRRHPAE
jgi:hypothetical protein